MRKQILILGHDYTSHFVDIFNQYTRMFDPTIYEVTLIYLTGVKSLEVREKSLAEHVIFLDIPKKKIRGLKLTAIKQLLNICRQKSFTQVICHRYKPSYIMMWVAQFCSIPSLTFVMHELNTMQAKGRQFLIRLLFKKNMYFAGVSNAVRDNIRHDLNFIPQSHIITLYNMIDVELTEPQLYSRMEARNALGMKDEDFVFGNLARLVPNKDQTSLIHAFAKLKKTSPAAKLFIIGKGELAESLNHLIKSYQLEDDIILTGFLPHAFRYLKAFDCFVLSSIQEAFGRVLLEAMIAKLPIIATKAHGIPEVMGKVGVLIKPKDIEGLQTAMKNIYTSSQESLQAQGVNLYQHMLEHFSIPTFYRQFWEIYQKHPI